MNRHNTPILLLLLRPLPLKNKKIKNKNLNKRGETDGGKMSSVQKLKLLALHCGTSASSSTTTSPSPPRLSTATNTAAPCFNFRRLLSRRLSLGGRNQGTDVSMKEGLLTDGHHHKLRDLFICSPPPHHDDDGSVIKMGHDNGGVRVNGFGAFSGRVEEHYPVRRRRFGSFGLRYRLLRGAWRPRLGAIPE